MPPLQARFQIVKGERWSWKVLKGHSGLSRGLEWGTFSLKLSFPVWSQNSACLLGRACACVCDKDEELGKHSARCPAHKASGVTAVPRAIYEDAGHSRLL